MMQQSFEPSPMTPREHELSLLAKREPSLREKRSDYFYRLVKGDCLLYFPRMPNETVDLILTSPPYPGNNKMWGKLFHAENFEKAHEFLAQVWKECLRVLKPGCKLIINIANTKRRPYLSNVAKLYETIDAEPLGEIIWDKGYGQCGTAWGSYCNPSDPSLADQHEYIVVFRKFGERQKEPGYLINARDFKSWRNSIWRIAPAKATEIGHVAPFPEKLVNRLVTLYSYESEVVLDPFLGSGTTMYVCQDLRRNCIGIEIKDEYCQVAKSRCFGRSFLDRKPTYEFLEASA